MALTKEQKTELIQAHGESATDTGSTVVQIAMLTKRINELTEHLKLNKKDFACRRGLMILVGRRRRLLNYFRKTMSADSYKELIVKMGLRK
jgi:small subunit ribosomal protein S15